MWVFSDLKQRFKLATAAYEMDKVHILTTYFYSSKRRRVRLICFSKRCCSWSMSTHDCKIFDLDEPKGSPNHYISVVSLHSTWRVAFKQSYTDKWFFLMVLKLHTFPLIEGQNQYRLFGMFLYGMPIHRSISYKNDKGLFSRYGNPTKGKWHSQNHNGAWNCRHVLLGGPQRSLLANGNGDETIRSCVEASRNYPIFYPKSKLSR